MKRGRTSRHAFVARGPVGGGLALLAPRSPGTSTCGRSSVAVVSLGDHHQTVTSLQDTAQALRPLVGSLAADLFAIGSSRPRWSPCLSSWPPPPMWSRRPRGPFHPPSTVSDQDPDSSGAPDRRAAAAPPARTGPTGTEGWHARFYVPPSPQRHGVSRFSDLDRKGGRVIRRIETTHPSVSPRL